MARTYHRRRLTKRERQCLQWTARGKSGWVIGRLLGITEHTVIFHRKQAMRKMRTASLVTAVGRAAAGDIMRLWLDDRLDEHTLLAWAEEWWSLPAGIDRFRNPH